jgi:predicted ABC-class ATPase
MYLSIDVSQIQVNNYLSFIRHNNDFKKSPKKDDASRWVIKRKKGVTMS